MDLNAMIQKVKAHPDMGKAGMILAHNGIVRESSRECRPVTGLKVTVDHGRHDAIVEEARSRQGIVEVLVTIEEGRNLVVGDDVMGIVVAGDIRERVIETLTETLYRIKTEATSKEQFFS